MHPHLVDSRRRRRLPRPRADPADPHRHRADALHGRTVDDATRIIYRAVAAEGQEPRLGYETRTRAAAAGIALPADPRHLTPWQPKNARDTKPLEHPRHPDLQHAILVDDDELDATESQTLAWAARESGTLGRYWEAESGLRGYRWYDELLCIIGVNVHMRSGTQTHMSTRTTRRDGESAFRGAIDEIELELLVKRTGQGAPGKVRTPASAALLSPEGGGTSEIEPIFVARRDASIDRSALCSALAEAYFQPSFDSDADSIDTQMREYIFEHPTKLGHVVVTHPRKDLPTGTLRNIYRQAGWDWRER